MRGGGLGAERKEIGGGKGGVMGMDAPYYFNVFGFRPGNSFGIDIAS